MAKEAIGIKVGDIMTRNFVSASPDANLIECAKNMSKKRVGSLILMEGKKIRGIISEKDIIWALAKKPQENLSRIKAKDIASRKTVTIKPSADLYDAIKKMKKSGYRRLPVVVKDNVIGILTIKDILRIEPTLMESAREVMEIREEGQKLKRREALARGATWPRWNKEGMCEECGNFDVLYRVDNRLLCEPCREAM
jgi:CBS domain-containing protein